MTTAGWVNTAYGAKMLFFKSGGDFREKRDGVFSRKQPEKAGNCNT